MRNARRESESYASASWESRRKREERMPIESVYAVRRQTIAQLRRASVLTPDFADHAIYQPVFST